MFFLSLRKRFASLKNSAQNLRYLHCPTTDPSFLKPRALYKAIDTIEKTILLDVLFHKLHFSTNFLRI
jgi:hypothetical protein